ncbi:MAG: VanZ family protein [Burkholderiales bacterium]
MLDPEHSAVRALAACFALAMAVPLFMIPQQIGAANPFTAPGMDKVVHATYYGIIAVLTNIAAGHRPVFALIVAAAIGAADEVNQLGVVNRSASWGDWVADVLGAVGGLLVYPRVLRWSAARRQMRRAPNDGTSP